MSFRCRANKGVRCKKPKPTQNTRHLRQLSFRSKRRPISRERQGLPHNGENGNAFVGLVELANGAVQLGHVRSAGVVESDNLPAYGVENRTAAAAPLGWRAIVQLLVTAGDQAIIVQRKFKIASAWMPNDVHAWSGFGHLERIGG